jgi:TPR repeat protein
MYNLAYYYEQIEKNYPLAIKYYQMAIEFGYSKAMYNLAYYYDEIEKNYPLAIKYYLMAIELNELNAMYNLAYYYDQIEKNYPQAIKYYLMAIELNDLNAMNNLRSISKIRPIEVLNGLNLINEPNEYCINLKNKLNKNIKVNIFNNKKRLFEELNCIKQCPICLDTKLNINLNCGHLICIDCYSQVDTCYLRCRFL